LFERLIRLGFNIGKFLSMGDDFIEILKGLFSCFVRAPLTENPAFL
jgi:hypothetical protein